MSDPTRFAQSIAFGRMRPRLSSSDEITQPLLSLVAKRAVAQGLEERRSPNHDANQERETPKAHGGPTKPREPTFEPFRTTIRARMAVSTVASGRAVAPLPAPTLPPPTARSVTLTRGRDQLDTAVARERDQPNSLDRSNAREPRAEPFVKTTKLARRPSAATSSTKSHVTWLLDGNHLVEAWQTSLLAAFAFTAGYLLGQEQRADPETEARKAPVVVVTPSDPSSSERTTLDAEKSDSVDAVRVPTRSRPPVDVRDLPVE